MSSSSRTLCEGIWKVFGKAGLVLRREVNHTESGNLPQNLMIL